MDYRVSGGQGGEIPGGIRPDALDGRLEWTAVPPRRGLLGAVAARLGSEADLDKIVLGVLAPLRGWLEGPPLEALRAALPPPLARELQDGAFALGAPVRRAHDAADLVATVSRLIQHPPARALAYVRAVLGALRDALPAAGIAGRLPPDLADAFAAAT
jgi:uncharacterized protein (DUF2267 family)